MKGGAVVKGEDAWQDADKPLQQRFRLVQTLNGDPAASPTRRRAQTWRSLFVAPRAPEATPPVLSSAAALLDGFLSILQVFNSKFLRPSYHS